MSPSEAPWDARDVLTLEEIGSLAEESGKPAEILMKVVALIANAVDPRERGRLSGGTCGHHRG